jgi:hypothetical protein
MGKSRAPWKTPLFIATGMFVLAVAAPAVRAEGESVTRLEPMHDLGGECSTLPARAEDGRRRNGPRAWLIRGFLTVDYGAAIAVSIAARDAEAGRPIATVAGVAGGWIAGAVAAYYGGVAGGLNDGKGETSVGFEGLIVGGSIVGGVLGGLAAHALAASPGARVPVTAIGLAPLYVLSIASTFQ